MREQENKLSPTDQMLNFLEGASKNQLQWEMMKRSLKDEVWQDNLIRSGVDLDMMNERIREIDFERRKLKETYVENDGLGKITRSRRIR